jgi:hypothetical protein
VHPSLQDDGRGILGPPAAQCLHFRFAFRALELGVEGDRARDVRAEMLPGVLACLTGRGGCKTSISIGTSASPSSIAASASSTCKNSSSSIAAACNRGAAAALPNERTRGRALAHVVRSSSKP